MRILVASPYLPWPLHTGGNAAQFSTLKCLSKDHEFTLICPLYNRAFEVCAQELQAKLPAVKVKAIYCGAPVEQPSLMARWGRRCIRFGRRMLTPDNPAQTPQPMPPLPYYPFYPLPSKYIEAVQAEIDAGIDLCQVEFAEMLQLGGWLPARVPRLFVQHQIHFVYAQRFAQNHARSTFANYLVSVMRTQELAYLQDFDGIITFSNLDRQTLLPHVAPEKLFASPFPIPADTGIATDIPPAFDGRFLFLGSAEHNPNADALAWLMTRIWPAIHKQLPGTRLEVIGQWSEQVKGQYQQPGVQFSGFKSDLAKAVRGGIMLVPLTVGSGIRVKIMVAMAQGVPVVSTSVGSEGLEVRDGEELFVRDEEQEFVAAAVRLASEERLWQQFATAGREAIARNYSPEVVRQRRNEIYAALVQNEQNVQVSRQR